MTATRIPFAKVEISAEAQDAANRVLASGWVTTGPEVEAFEREFSVWLGVEHAVAVASCTDAIELSLRALGLPEGARILTSTMTFCGAVNAIVHARLRPVFADVCSETLMPDREAIREAARRAGGVAAMVVTHFAGHPAPVDELAAAAGLPPERVIEDAAHALGASLGGRPVGTLSHATCFSFYATKNLPIGEGGMITTRDAAFADYVRRARLHGMSRDAWKRYLPGAGWRYDVEVPGLKSNMTDLQAAIGRAQMVHFHGWQRRREEIARRYHDNLSDIPGIHTPVWPEAGVHAWHLYVVRVAPEFGLDRDSLCVRLAERGIDCSVHFIPLHHQTYFRRMLGEPLARCFPTADAMFPEILSLPLYPALTDAGVDRVCSEIADLRRSAPGPRFALEGLMID